MRAVAGCYGGVRVPRLDGPFRPTLYVSPALDAAETHHVPPSFTMAPFCQEPRPRAEFE